MPAENTTRSRRVSGAVDVEMGLILSSSYPRTARTVSGVEFLVGFATEFILLTSTSPVTTVHDLQGYSNSLALPTGSIAEQVLEEIVNSLEISGVEVQMYHAEAAPGQVTFYLNCKSPITEVSSMKSSLARCLHCKLQTLLFTLEKQSITLQASTG